MEKESENKKTVLISKRQLLAIIPLCERTIYNFEKQGKFPRRIALSSRKVVWDLAEVEDGLILVGSLDLPHVREMGA